MAEPEHREKITGADWDADKAIFLADPSIENFLGLREQYPDKNPPNQIYTGIEPLFAMQDDLARWEIDPCLLSRAMDAETVAIEELSLQLLGLLSRAKKMRSSGETHSVSRGKATPGSFIDYLIVIMLESMEQYDEPHAIPAFNFLIRERLGGTNMGMHQAYQKKFRKKMAVALLASSRRLASMGKFDSPISLSAVAKQLGLDKSSLSRMFKKGELQALIDAELKLPPLAEPFLDDNDDIIRALHRDLRDQQP